MFSFWSLMTALMDSQHLQATGQPRSVAGQPLRIRYQHSSQKRSVQNHPSMANHSQSAGIQCCAFCFLFGCGFPLLVLHFNEVRSKVVLRSLNGEQN